MQRVASTPRLGPAKSPAASASPWRRFTLISFILSLALVACRALMFQAIRSAQDPLAGGVAAPGTPGPASGIVLDLLLVLPALLVLGRRAFDDHYRLIFNWSLVPMGLLALLAALSPLWAADKFAAVVSAAHLLAALVLFWSTAQLIRTWLGLKLIAGACLGLLMALSAVGYYYHTIEMSDLRQTWQKQKDELLQEHGWKPGSYEAKLFENRVLKGQPMGFSTSTNTYAALLVLLGTVTAGIVVQHIADEDHWGWYAVPILAIASVGPLIAWTGCRAAYVTPILGAMILLAIGYFRRPMARYAGAIYGGVIVLLAGVTAIVVRHGMGAGTLWHDSLTFRWRYWVGSLRVMTAGFEHSPRQFFHFFFGVGWENFGPYYLGRRLAIASEEIRDPHNFIVRVFVELGVVGGLLLLAWMLRFWWEITRPAPPAEAQGAAPGALSSRMPAAPPGQPIAMGIIAAIVITAIAINVAISIDFTGDGWYAFLEVARRGVFLCFLVIGLSLAALRMPSEMTFRSGDTFEVELDDRPAPWIAYAILAALATFLVHNLIEFSMFEPGPLFLFALLGGAILGVRGEATRKIQSHSQAPAPAPHARAAATGAMALGAALWLAAAILLATPVAVAEQLARSADNDAYQAVNLRPGLDPARAQELLVRATTEMVDAWRRLPWNADYAARAARLQIAAGIGQHDPRQVKQTLDAAVKADPSAVQNLSMRARFEFSVLDDPEAGRRDFERALALDPNNVRMRLTFARELKGWAMTSKQPDVARTALLEYTRALDMNNLLAPDEMKRLTDQERSESQAAIAELEAFLESLKVGATVGRSF